MSLKCYGYMIEEINVEIGPRFLPIRIKGTIYHLSLI